MAVLFYGLVSCNPAVKKWNEDRLERRKERQKRRGDYYDPETSVYNNRTEHDICRAIINWDRW